MRMDEYIDELFTKEAVFDVTLPVIPKRYILEQNNEIEARISLLDADLMLDEFEVKNEENETNLSPEAEKKKGFFEDSGEEDNAKDVSHENESKKLGANSQRWDKIDINNEDNFKQEKNFNNFEKKKENKLKSRSRSRSREKKHNKKRSRSRSDSRKKSKNEAKHKDSKLDKNKDENSKKKDVKDDKKEDKKLDENSVEYWNSLRAKLGLDLIPKK